MKYIKTVINFFKSHYLIFLLVIVLISYGQLLLMFPWQDDHALMFKLANIEGKAGYLGTGLFGQGPYKYTAFFYYPIYLLFGYNIPLFFLESLIFYFLATVAVYKVFSKVINEKTGRLAGFIFACGYIANDGFIRLYNSVGTSLSIVLILFLIYSYWEYFKKNNIKWYLFALFFYFLAVEFVRYRTHYLIAVIFFFEVIFLAFKKPVFKSLINSIIRLIPFGYVFYKYFITAADERSGRVVLLIKNILSGELYKLYGFFASLGNLFFPDWLVKIKLFKIPNFGFINFPNLSLSPQAKLSFVLGLFVLFLGLYLINKIKENKKIYLLLFIWVLLNIAGYAAYEPTVARETGGRFLAHSFVALSGLLAVISQRKKWVYFVVLLFALGNLRSSFINQKIIVAERSRPPKIFYQQLKNHVPQLKKGDILYFDNSDSMRQKFSDAFSVAQMPEETAIAWRYGIDRYDVRRFTDYDSFIQTLNGGTITDINKEPVKINNFYTFFYSDEGLVNTTDEFTDALNNRGGYQRIEFDVLKNQDNSVDLVFKEPIPSILPVKLNIYMKAVPKNFEEIDFITKDKNVLLNSTYKDPEIRNLSFKYQDQKNALMDNVKTSALNFWQKDRPENIVDGRVDTYWRADRVLWKKDGSIITFDLGKPTLIDKFVWINGYANNTPTRYKLETSTDNTVWKEVFGYANIKRIEPTGLNVDSFEPVAARYLRMVIESTLSTDSASISEAWIVPYGFDKLDIQKAEEFLKKPFDYVENNKIYLETLTYVNYSGNVQISWLGDKSGYWKTTTNSIIHAVYDGRLKVYNFQIPSGGTKIEKIMLLQSHVPGVLDVVKIEFR